jgi:hypothetical protein
MLGESMNIIGLPAAYNFWCCTEYLERHKCELIIKIAVKQVYKLNSPFKNITTVVINQNRNNNPLEQLLIQPLSSVIKFCAFYVMEHWVYQSVYNSTVPDTILCQFNYAHLLTSSFFVNIYLNIILSNLQMVFSSLNFFTPLLCLLFLKFFCPDFGYPNIQIFKKYQLWSS